ncbi:1-acyl-sn-glycerol-3-phosphate acyltransferase [Hoeflea sp. TYP-13]|uniref:1-acyl-sn-glycerol-3-phosphate acyltransferase n=1 Tax=Hoeflea sp. TYP-13 TaxID=3230023 RepID=UPI0034C6A250
MSYQEFINRDMTTPPGFVPQSPGTRLRGNLAMNNLLRRHIPFVYGQGGGRMLRPVCDQIINRRKADVILGELARCSTGAEIIEKFRVALAPRVVAAGSHHIPTSGGGIVVANYPTGISDGAALYNLLRHLRRDVSFILDSELLKINPNAADTIVPLDYRRNGQAPSIVRRAVEETRNHLAQDRLVVMFPAGIMALREGGVIRERDWQRLFVSLATIGNVPVIPAHILARNSRAYYFWRNLSEPLAKLQYARELNQRYSSEYAINVGHPIDIASLKGRPHEKARKIQYFVEEILIKDPEARIA